MPFSEELLRRLRATFADEANDHLQALNRHLLALEGRPEPEQGAHLLQEMFRAAHTLKGAARAVNLEAVGQVAHALETLMGRLRDGRLDVTTALFDLLYQALDVLTALVQSGETPATTAAVPGLLARLEAAAVDQPAPPGLPPSASPFPAAAPAPVAPAPAPEAVAAARPAPADETIRISTLKLDALMAKVGELQIARISHEARLAGLRELLETTDSWDADWRRLREHYRPLRSPSVLPANGQPAAAPSLPASEILERNDARFRATRAELLQLRASLEADNRRLAQLVDDLQDDVRRTRLRPLSTVLDTFPRMLRDLSQELGKDAALLVEGGETEVDRSVLEQIKASLMHLLRNCVDHGLETPAARVALGKPPAGQIRLAASQFGSSLRLEISDDGAGIDLDRVKQRAQQLGLLTSEAAAGLSDAEALALIFRAGFSTRAVTTSVSGRGIGLDVVRQNVERLNGWVDVDSRPGLGTRFVLSVPLSVATTLCLLAQAGGQTFGLPASSVLRLVRVGPGDIRRLDGREVILVDGQPVILARLAGVLGLPPAADPPPGLRLPALVVGSVERRFALLVDSVLGAQDVIAKGLPRPWLRVQHVAGAAILGTGEVVLVLNTADLGRSVARVAPAPVVAGAPEPEPSRVPTIMVSDDSLTTRTLEKNILEAAGYNVLLAGDGLDAWTQLQAAPCDLLVADVNMPRMDGFQLVETIRADARLKDLPVILVTSLDSREDLERGIAAGADAYIVKGAFDQDQLLATIRRLI